jgi:hypothetical protein
LTDWEIYSSAANAASSASVNQGYGYGVQGQGGTPSKELLTLALNTLGTFDFSGELFVFGSLEA